jgi:hypothetical protein
MMCVELSGSVIFGMNVVSRSLIAAVMSWIWSLIVVVTGLSFCGGRLSSPPPSRPLILPLPTLLAYFEAKPVSSKALSASSEALSYIFVVFSFFNNCIAQSFTVNPPFIGINDCSICFILEIIEFDFFKIGSMHFGKPSPYTRPSTLFVGVLASVYHQNCSCTTSTRRSVSSTRL